MGRVRSNVAPHARQRYSYRGTREAYVTPVPRGRGGAGLPAGEVCPFGAAPSPTPGRLAAAGAGGAGLTGTSS